MAPTLAKSNSDESAGEDIPFRENNGEQNNDDQENSEGDEDDEEEECFLPIRLDLVALQRLIYFKIRGRKDHRSQTRQSKILMSASMVDIN